jgi:hypothetical protein
LQYVGRALECGLELMKGLFPFAVILECLKPAGLVFKDRDLGLQQEIFSGERHGNSFLKGDANGGEPSKTTKGRQGERTRGHDPNGRVKHSWIF